ncbi:uncharacterized protein LOC123200178 isoform X2 [Mangifera indica]|uniref:uncharacterized protein LOC123200178 isoform X2 n=1 Tax=Mangifera indica TaxID=29780 RepID=UPI001CFC0594|nr:uncharacterized protein LOC123200178 isoform X2 [Mangifera indica]
MLICSRSSFFLLVFLSVVLFTCQTSATSYTLRIAESENGEVLPWKIRRSLADETIASNSTLILAANRTQRRDPLADFKTYTGGWNISERHYWASVGFTAAPFFIIAAVWFALFGLCLCFICLCYCCCRREPYGYSRLCYALSLIFLIFFTISAIVGSIVLYTAQGKFNNHTSDTLGYVLQQANVTGENLKNVSEYLYAAKQITVNSVSLPVDLQSGIDSLDAKINSSAITLSYQTEKNSKTINNALDSTRLALIIIAAVMLFLAFVGFLFSILGLQSIVYFLVVIGWILVAGTFVLCGVFLLLHNVVADSCVAMDEWVQHPTAHTALDDILPCVDNATAQETLLKSKNVTQQLVGVVDNIIRSVANSNLPPQAGPVFYNQSGPMVPPLCNPFNPDLTDRKCEAGEVDLYNAPEVWKKYVCEVSSSNMCTGTGRLIPIMYNQMAAAVNVSYVLYRYSPFLIGLQDCSFVRDTFTVISSKYCPGMRSSTSWIYIGLVMVSAAVMFSLIFWVIYARERRHRIYTKRVDAKTHGGIKGRDIQN